MIIRVISEPVLVITGDSYSADVPVAAIDDKGWVIRQTALKVTGLITEANLGTNFLARLKTASDAWKGTLSTAETVRTKLSGLVGKTL